jgi:chromosomal replication initiation ATPase DnaA
MTAIEPENLCHADGLYLSLWRGLIPRRAPTMAGIAQKIADREGLTLEQLRGRYQAIARAPLRQEAWAEIYETGGFSLPQIGQWFDERDHSTIHYGNRQHRARLERAA